MQPSTRRFLFYVIIFILCFCMALLSVVMSVRTVAINNRIIEKEAQIAKLKIQNDYAEYKLLQRLQLKNLEEMATDRLQMRKVDSYEELN